MSRAADGEADSTLGLGTGSLAGVRVVVTRARAQAAPLIEAFRQHDAEVALLPLLAVTSPDDGAPLAAAVERIESYDRLVFSSANAVNAVLPHCSGRRLPPIAVVGPATAAAVRRAGFEVGREAVQRDGAGLAQALADRVRGQRVLLPQAEDAQLALAQGLRDAGAQLEAVVAYAKILPPEALEQARTLFATTPVGWVTFTSPRIVRHFFHALETVLGTSWPTRREELRAAAIGSTTAAALRRRNIQPAIAREPTPGALAAAILRAHQP